MAHVLLASMRGRSIVPSIRRTFTRVFAPRRCFASSGSHDGAAVPLAFGDHELDLIQQKLSQLQRRRIKASAERRRAAVLVPLCTYRNQPAILYTLRSHHVGSHKGEVAFPGGFADEDDDDDPDLTAAREANEEVGIGGDLLTPTVFLMGHFHDVMAKTNVAVTPVVGYIGEVVDSQIREMARFNPDEIADVFVLTIPQLLDPAHVSYQTYDSKAQELHPNDHGPSNSDSSTPSAQQPSSAEAAVNHKLRIKVFSAGPHAVRGLTAFITNEFLTTILVGPTGIWPHLTAK